MHSRGYNAQSTLKKAVKFGDEVLCHVHEVESFRDVASIWWTKDEISDIERESEAIIYFLNNTAGSSNSANVDIDLHSIRGLEKKTEIGAWEMFETQRDARNAVLCLQDKQRKFHHRPVTSIGDRSSSLDSGMKNVLDAQEAIANVYQAASLKARRAAYEAGLRDFLEAKRDGKPTNGPISPVVPVQKTNKVVPITSEPMIPKWGRKISMPLMNPSDNSESSSKSTVTKEVQLILATRNGRTGAAPKIRSSLSPPKKRRPKQGATEAAFDLSKDSHVEANEPTRSASLRRKALPPEGNVMRSASFHKKVPSENADKSEFEKPVRRRTTSPRKVSAPSQTELATTAPTSNTSQPRKKISSTLSGDIFKRQKALVEFENNSISCDDMNLKNESEQINVKVRGSTRNAAKKSMEKQVPNPDLTGEKHRIRVVVKTKRRPSKDSLFRYCPARSTSNESKGNQTADTSALLDLSNSSSDSSGYRLDSTYHQSNCLTLPPLSSDSELGSSGTILSNLFKRMGGDRKNIVTTKT
jgi:hypothetical protein